jgi:hypothetical protein
MFDHNQQVWVQHPPNPSGTWHLGNVHSESKSGVVVGMLLDPSRGTSSPVQEVVVPETFVVGVHPDHLKIWNDMVAMGELHEAAILYNLQQRYRKDQIYVSLLSVLPFSYPSSFSISSSSSSSFSRTSFFFLFFVTSCASSSHPLLPFSSFSSSDLHWTSGDFRESLQEDSRSLRLKVD